MSEKLDLDYQSIGRRLQRRRIELEMTQAKLAEITDLSVPYISQIESGKKSARMSTLVSIANALGLSMDEIFAENVNKAEFVLKKEIQDLLEDCDSSELGFLLACLHDMKGHLRKFSEQRYKKYRYE